jgi:hypothetical protein
MLCPRVTTFCDIFNRSNAGKFQNKMSHYIMPSNILSRNMFRHIVLGRQLMRQNWWKTLTRQNDKTNLKKGLLRHINETNWSSFLRYLFSVVALYILSGTAGSNKVYNCTIINLWFLYFNATKFVPQPRTKTSGPFFRVNVTPISLWIKVI